jgi:hypothetical protein
VKTRDGGRSTGEKRHVLETAGLRCSASLATDPWALRAAAVSQPAVFAAAPAVQVLACAVKLNRRQRLAGMQLLRGNSNGLQESEHAR